MAKTGRPKKKDRSAVASKQLHVRMTDSEWRKLDQLTHDLNKTLATFGFPAVFTKAMLVRKLVKDARSVDVAPAEMAETLRALMAKEVEAVDTPVLPSRRFAALEIDDETVDTKPTKGRRS
jgi:hypothetical protein